jgi:hypothetical protein
MNGGLNMQQFNLGVDFDTVTKAVTILGMDQNLSIYVPQGISLITFTLDGNALAAEASFASAPMQWLGPTGAPVESPTWFYVDRYDGSHFALWDFNSAPVQTSHPFVISVFYQGQFYSNPDPVIVNEPPSS